MEAMSALWFNDYLPLGLGTQALMLASGIAIVRAPAPSALGWVAVVLCVVAGTPVGFVGFVGAGVWVAIAGFVLARRGVAPAAGTSSPSPAPAH
jgi:hypothetical protein